jgi:hypothetical protein
VFIWFILGEQILPSTYVGLVLIMAGLWLQQKKAAEKQDVAAGVANGGG